MKKFLVLFISLVIPVIAFSAPISQNYHIKADPASGTNRTAQSVMYETDGQIGINTTSPNSVVDIKTNGTVGGLNIVGTSQTNSLFLNNKFSFWFNDITNPSGSGTLPYLVMQPVPNNSTARFALFPKGTVSGTSNTMIAGIKIFQDDYSTDLTNSCDFGMYMTSDGMRFNTKQNGTCPAFPINFGRQDTTIDMTIDTNGSVGLGTTTSPSGKLTILQSADNSNSGINVSNSTNNSSLRLWANSSTNGAKIDSGVNGNSPLIINTGTGNVGIGAPTGNPLAKLDVYTGTTQSVRISSSQTGATGGSVLQIGQNSGAAVASGSRVSSIQSFGATDSSNTTAVSSAIDFISGSAYSGSNLETDMRVRLVPSGSTTLTEYLRIKSDGKVGIGTSAPSDTLQILGGSIRAAGYKSSDGTAGVTVTTCTSFKNGLCVAGT